jgi:hypothetical protein
MVLRISWSGLRTHEECKQRGYLTRTGKKATLDNQRNFFPGNVTDRTVRRWLLEDPANNIGRMPSMVSDVIEQQYAEVKDQGGVMRWKDKGDRQKVLEDCTEAVAKIEPLLLKYVVPFEYIPDFSFTAPLQLPHPAGGLEVVHLIGFMDILVRDNHGRYWVWDVKHTRDSSYWRKTIAQIGFYDLAVELKFGEPMFRGGLLQPLVKKSVVPYSPSEDSRTQLRTRIAGMARDIWLDDRSPRTDTKECDWCVVKHACEKFKPVVQDDGSRRMTLRRS